MKLAPDLPWCNYSSNVCSVSFKPKDLASPVRESGDCSLAIVLATLEKLIFHFDPRAPINVSINQMLGGLQSDFHRRHLPEAEVRGGPSVRAKRQIPFAKTSGLGWRSTAQ